MTAQNEFIKKKQKKDTFDLFLTIIYTVLYHIYAQEIFLLDLF